MDELLSNPAVQAAGAPFVLALAAAAALRGSRLLGLATGVGFVTAVVLVLGFSFESLTATRKLILIAAASLAALAGIELARLPNAAALRSGIAAAVALGALWVGWRVLAQKETAAAVTGGAGAAAFMAVLVYSCLHPRIAGDSVRASSTSLALGLGMGGLALLGASASLAQAAIAVGAGAGAGLLVQMIGGRRAPSGWTLALPAAVAAGLIGLVSVFTGVLAWYALLPMLAVPWASALVPTGNRPVWLQSILCALAALAPALLAVAFIWFRPGVSAA